MVCSIFLKYFSTSRSILFKKSITVLPGVNILYNFVMKYLLQRITKASTFSTEKIFLIKKT
jgi:hypothetical protein